MSWRPAALLPLILGLWACAEGGTRGSGIAASVVGNVASVQTAAVARASASGAPGLRAEMREFFRVEIEQVARARTEIEGIQVAIEGTGAQVQTDANGNFSLRGDFEGLISLVFQTPDGGAPVRLPLNVPAAGTLTLHDVHIDTEQGEATVNQQDVDFQGLITATDCQGLTLTLVSAQRTPDDTDHYTMHLDTSSLQDTQGNPVACEDLRGGEQALIQGVVYDDGTFGNATIELKG